MTGAGSAFASRKLSSCHPKIPRYLIFRSFVTPGDLKLHNATASRHKIQQTCRAVVKPLLKHKQYNSQYPSKKADSHYGSLGGARCTHKPLLWLGLLLPGFAYYAPGIYHHDIKKLGQDHRQVSRKHPAASAGALAVEIDTPGWLFNSGCYVPLHTKPPYRSALLPVLDSITDRANGQSALWRCVW